MDAFQQKYIYGLFQSDSLACSGLLLDVTPPPLNLAKWHVHVCVGPFNTCKQTKCKKCH